MVQPLKQVAMEVNEIASDMKRNDLPSTIAKRLVATGETVK
jgi:hypothetical protein